MSVVWKNAQLIDGFELCLRLFVVVLTLTCENRSAESTARSHSALTSPPPAALVL